MIVEIRNPQPNCRRTNPRTRYIAAREHAYAALFTDIIFYTGDIFVRGDDEIRIQRASRETSQGTVVDKPVEGVDYVVEIGAYGDSIALGGAFAVYAPVVIAGLGERDEG